MKIHRTESLRVYNHAIRQANISTATYVRNRTLTNASDGRTPYDMVYGAKPDLADLRAFGAPCAIVEPGARLGKLDDRSTKCFDAKHALGHCGGDQGGGGGAGGQDEPSLVLTDGHDASS